MAEIYLAQFGLDYGPDPERLTNIRRWKPPVPGWTGCIDLRNRTQAGTRPNGNNADGYCLLTYPTAQSHPLLIRHLGSVFDGQLSGTEVNVLRSLTGNQFTETRIDRVIEELLTNFGDPSGENERKPFRISKRKGGTIRLGPFSIPVAFSESHPAFQQTIEVFRKDYERHVLEGTPLTVRRKFTGATMISLYGRAGDDLLGILPLAYQSDGWAQPTTTIGDTFVESGNVDIDAHTATGPNGGFSWALMNSYDASVRGASDTVDQVSRTQGVARAESDLSTDDHQAEIDLLAFDTNSEMGAAVRCSTSATSWYNGHFYDNASAPKMQIERMETSTSTLLAEADQSDPTATANIRLTVDGSNLELFLDDVSKVTDTDTNLTGNLRCGIYGNGSFTPIEEYDNFEASDIGAPPAANPKGVFGLALHGPMKRVVYP